MHSQNHTRRTSAAADLYSLLADAALQPVPVGDDRPTPPPEAYDNGGGVVLDFPLGKLRELFAEAGSRPLPQPASPPTLTTIAASAWAGLPVPPREWAVSELIPRGTVSMLSGDGGTGKSMLAVQLAVARALGRPWIGLETEPGPTLYLSAEDDAPELHRRVDAVLKHYNAAYSELQGLAFADLVGDDAVLGALDRTTSQIRATALYQRLAQTLSATRPPMIIIDSLADVFAGNEIDRGQARQFIGLLKRLCRNFSTTCLVISHPSLTGLASGTGASGSTAWSNSVRSRLYLTADPDDPNRRQLTTKKTNYAARGGNVDLRYVDGAFAVVGATVNDRVAADDALFLLLLAALTAQGRSVSASPGPTYAPTILVGHPDARGVDARRLRGAMERLLAARKIAVEEFGPPSKRRSRLVVLRT